MTHDNSPVTEDELHAYIDGELPADRVEAVTAWLATHEDAAVLVTAWRAQADAIRARYGATVSEPVPARLKLDQLMQRNRRWVSMAAAAAVAAFMFGGATGWVAHSAAGMPSQAMASIASDAIDAHRLYVVEVRHAVEVPGEDRTHITQWLSKRLGYQLLVPDLQSDGLKLVGGRLLPGPTGAAAFYMYETASGERFTMYCTRANTPEMALRYKGEDRTGAFYWADRDVAYVVSGPADRDRLEQVTKTIYDQIERANVHKL